MTAVTCGLTQPLWLITTAAMSRVQHQDKNKVCDDDEDSSAVTSMAQNGVSRMVAFPSTIAQNPFFHKLGGMLTVLVVGRLLRISGVMKTASHAIPLALVLGVLCRIAIAHSWTEGPNTEDGTSAVAKENPYDVAFWSELVPTAFKASLVDKVLLDPADILSDVYHGLM